jgi:toxin HigB-1
MILRFQHKGLARFFTTGSLPGLRLHPLKGSKQGRWAVDVSGNWRVTFCFTGIDADDVDYEDYH